MNRNELKVCSVWEQHKKRGQRERRTTYEESVKLLDSWKIQPKPHSTR